MAYKIERWIADAYRGEEQLLTEYRDLPARELVITACAMLDVALVELLSLRLVDDAAESESFLGADEDGRAPAGSFGARIQMAYLVGILAKALLRPLQALRKLRNVMAHRVNASLLSDKAQVQLEVLRRDFEGLTDEPPPGQADALMAVQQFVTDSKHDESAARRMVLFNFVAFHYTLRKLVSDIGRIRAAPSPFDDKSGA